ncbi:MAG TPA: F0F1 ATP synthase subunit A [Abditibacterium sp.]|jgi:F-type H+-transporting ATPase subunit a
MMARFFRFKLLFLLLGVTIFAGSQLAWAAPEAGSGAFGAAESAVDGTHSADGDAVAAGGHDNAHGGDHGDGHGGGHDSVKPVFEPEHGTWFNSIARAVFAQPGEKGPHGPAVKYDFLIFTPVLWALLALVLVSAARKTKIRPQGKATSATSVVEAMVDGFQNYLIGVMGEKMARKYLPLIASFFFTILVSNYVGLVPGMLAPSAMPAIPIALAIVAFFATHLVAIKETGFKSWFMHFVGEPKWLAPLNFPLHLVGELIKPISLSLRLLCNIFGEEQVVATLIGLAILSLPTWLPIPFQLPMLFLGVLFGFLQALVFSTLLAIYISVLSTHHDEEGHEHQEHAHDSHGNVHNVGVASASPVA